MKIVVLDGYTLNPGDLSWEGLEKIGDLTVYDRTEFESEVILKNIGDAEIVFTNKTPLTKEVIQKAPNLKYIGVLATGYNVVDVEAAKSRDVIVTNVPEYSTKSVAQFTMALLLEMCHHVGNHNQAVQNGAWSSSPDFSFWNHPLIELDGKTLGIIGFGNIGQATAKIAQAFGLNILTYSRTKYPELESETCKFVSLDELLNNSDIISLHCPLFPETKHIINKTNIDKMKDGVMIINTSRGPLIHEEDLRTALNNDKVYAAAIDVASVEPIEANNPLLSDKNCIITPHIAWAPIEARTRLMKTAIENLEAFIAENPVNVVG
ncbi:D-2-hydroxyacid dehydrogenase [Tamlana sp. s12]|uniref:D-2-hydroxyacid dehydrogenase n=1 Tax=Tamlana sp. s12 TaxID=1630406 RepID=UPI000801B88D|nr:D-2-hydroxyacid dehydrogenase [Tamlana sp. s12]OBQ51774.1 glycerate dehydrogenase [Tamlana sp. s12]QQY81541.1 D-2-hydroxyacid dehydrogenase [Tamlana sp. s12]